MFARFVCISEQIRFLSVLAKSAELISLTIFHKSRVHNAAVYFCRLVHIYWRMVHSVVDSIACVRHSSGIVKHNAIVRVIAGCLNFSKKNLPPWRYNDTKECQFNWLELLSLRWKGIAEWLRILFVWSGNKFDEHLPRSTMNSRINSQPSIWEPLLWRKNTGLGAEHLFTNYSMKCPCSYDRILNNYDR